MTSPEVHEKQMIVLLPNILENQGLLGSGVYNLGPMTGQNCIRIWVRSRAKTLIFSHIQRIFSWKEHAKPTKF